MARVLILSSFVARGHVGLSAALPILQALGHEVTGLPSVILSNHPGWLHSAGRPLPVDQLSAMVEALVANGWLGDHQAALVGYLPSVAHVAFAAELLTRLRDAAPGVRTVVDPVLGDSPKGLYVPPDVAAAVRDLLIPLADILTPNLFELSWLTGRETATLAEALAAARALCPAKGRVLVTSAPLGPAHTGVLEVSAGPPRLFRSDLRRSVPHGVGDAFAALIAGGVPVGQALGHLDALIAASVGAPHLAIASAAADWTRAAEIAADPIPFPHEVSPWPSNSS